MLGLGGLRRLEVEVFADDHSTENSVLAKEEEK